jgi:putative acetyltransferase
MLSIIHVPMLIRTERPTDAAAVRAVVAAAFPTALEAALVDGLRATGRLAISLVAEMEGEVIGHIAFSPVTAGPAKDGLGLAPLAVHPSHQRQGIGVGLVRAGLEACRGAGCGFVVVLGDPDYYRRCGFAPAANWQLTDEYGGGPAFQAIELREGACPIGPQLVQYAPEFAAFGPS